ncbi:MAG: altronate oxidoreductase, partial [Muribaculaceae bacterium]|nr:altronate oxidoreductase [Muribaculaceae bacterium]
MEIKKLNNSTVEGRKERPVRVLQFGEGNFLRAFVDWQLDIANEKGVIDTSVALISPLFKESRVLNILVEDI